MIVYLSSKIYAFLTKDCDIKIFSLFIFIKIIISCLSHCVNISFFNIKERIRRVIKVKFNALTMNNNLLLTFCLRVLSSFLYYKHSRDSL